jgi:hypothetical protein
VRRLVLAGLLALAGAACSDDDAAPTPTTAPPTTVRGDQAIPTDAESYAEAFVEAWLTGDRATADQLGTDEAVEAIFALEAGDGWALDHCEGAAGSSYCTFTAGGDPTVVVRVGNEAASLGEPDAVTEVQAP